MTSKKDSMYIKACVIANGLQDKQNDIISKKDIKRVFTNSLDVGFDINHDNIRKREYIVLKTILVRVMKILMEQLSLVGHG